MAAARHTYYWNQEAYDRYVRKEVEKMTAARTTGAYDLFAWTDDEIQAQAERLAWMNHAGDVYRP